MDANGFHWPDGQRAAVSLTYDDALPVHHEHAAPRLREAGLNATFYCNAHEGFTKDPRPWRAVAAAGHELGNHMLFHPCRREPAEGYDWLPPCYDLVGYTPERWLDEARIANCLLNLIDGREARSFGNTCCHAELGPADAPVALSDLILKRCVAGRGPFNSRIVTPASLDYGALGHFGADGKTFSQIESWLTQTIDAGGWVILMIHGVGPDTHDHGLFIQDSVHAQLLGHLSAHRRDIWTAPVVDVARHLQQAGYEGHRRR